MRTVYEDLSRFSASLSQCSNFAAIQVCLQKNLKFLFTYEIARFSYYKEDTAISFTILPKVSYMTTGFRCLFDFEKELRDTHLPVHRLCDDAFRKQYMTGNCANLKPDDMWNWHYSLGANEGIISSILSGEQQHFDKLDIPIVKIAVENMAAKIINTKLIQELDERSREISEALKKLELQNRLVTQLVEEQEDVIKQRTLQLEDKNKKILRLYNMKAHSVREPLSRIQGLLQLTDLMQLSDISSYLIPKLNVSANDLDYAIKYEIKTIDEEIFSGIQH